MSQIPQIQPKKKKWTKITLVVYPDGHTEEFPSQKEASHATGVIQPYISMQCNGLKVPESKMYGYKFQNKF